MDEMSITWGGMKQERRRRDKLRKRAGSGLVWFWPWLEAAWLGRGWVDALGRFGRGCGRRLPRWWSVTVRPPPAAQVRIEVDLSGNFSSPPARRQALQAV